eukprot:496417_1
MNWKEMKEKKQKARNHCNSALIYRILKEEINVLLSEYESISALNIKQILFYKWSNKMETLRELAGLQTEQNTASFNRNALEIPYIHQTYAQLMKSSIVLYVLV